MRVLLCADIHGNADALAAVLAEPADYVLCAGDLVHMGPAPVECLDLIRRRAAVVVRGNHDHGAGFGGDCRAYALWRSLDEASRQVTDAMLSEAHKRYLRSLPLTENITLGATRFTVVHAAPSEPLYHYLQPGTSDETWAAEISCTDADVLVLGHTHLPLLRTQMCPTVVNPGSVGLPRDGTRRAEYAIWENGVVTLHQRPYDHTRLLLAIGRLPLSTVRIHALMALFDGQHPRYPERAGGRIHVDDCTCRI